MGGGCLDGPQGPTARYKNIKKEGRGQETVLTHWVILGKSIASPLGPQPPHFEMKVIVKTYQEDPDMYKEFFSLSCILLSFTECAQC